MIGRTLGNLVKTTKSTISSNSRTASMSTIRYHDNGHPFKVLEVEEDDKIGDLSPNEVQLKFLAAPINHADLNMIQGGYGIKPVFPAVGGNEGVAKVVAVGSNVKTVAKDDHVIPSNAGFGTWRSTAVASENDVTKISKDIPIEIAATMAVNPCTAYRLLNDFADLKEGDVIVQNGANSAVGMAVVQLAASRGIRTINIVRNDEDYENKVVHLKGLGATIVCVPDYVASADYRRLVEDLPAPKLGLNCTGGPNCTELIRTLGKDATLVTYGGMSRQPVTIPTSSLIFKNITLRGFWMSEWVKNATVEERVELLQTIEKLFKEEKLKMWIEKHKFSEFERAISAVVNRTTKRKVVLMMEE